MLLLQGLPFGIGAPMRAPKSCARASLGSSFGAMLARSAGARPPTTKGLLCRAGARRDGRGRADGGRRLGDGLSGKRAVRADVERPYDSTTTGTAPTAHAERRLGDSAPEAIAGAYELGSKRHPRPVPHGKRGVDEDELRADRLLIRGNATCPGRARIGAVSSQPANEAPYRLIDEVEFGHAVVVSSFTNLYGCQIGDETRIGPFVEIQRGVVIGARCKIQSHSFICSGVEIEDEVFVGHGTIFINDRLPRATTEAGRLKRESDWTLSPTVVERGAALGSGAVVLGGVRIGAGALVGAGAVVTHNVAPGETVAGVPARAAAATNRIGTGTT